MDLMALFMPASYWLLAAMWLFIFGFYLRRLISPKLEGRIFHTLLLILAIDAFRTLLESVYFGALRTSSAGLLPFSVYNFLILPTNILLPKLVNIVAASLVIFIMLFRWLPQETRHAAQQEAYIRRLEGSIAERRKAEKALSTAKDELEARVDARTAELLAANRQLAAEIEERRQAQLEKERLIADLEAKNAELEQFTYTVSHDLKSPLVTIKGFVGFIRRNMAAGCLEQVDEDLKRISGAAGKMQQLLEELLALSRIGRITHPHEAVAMVELVRQVLAGLAPAIQQNRIAVTLDENLPTVFGDRLRLREVLENLIGNAIKFMGKQPAPAIQIGVQREADPPVFFVRDNGAGIEARHHEKVFGLFDRLDQSVPGTGVGLAIARRIVAVHGGRLWVASEGEGRGSTFYFTLQGEKIPADSEEGGSERRTVGHPAG